MNSSSRPSPEGNVPFVNCEGSSYECGMQLGEAWRHVLEPSAAKVKGCCTPWWWKGPVTSLVQQKAPHLVDIFRGMAKGAGIDEKFCSFPAGSTPVTAYTSFAVHEDQTDDGIGLAGQTKDTPLDRTFLYQVLRLKPDDGPGLLTLTYPGDLIGYGFAQNGMSIFRNALYVTPKKQSGDLPFDAFGLLTYFSSCLDDVIELAKKHGVQTVAHLTVADQSGRAVGLELSQGKVEVIEGHEGLYAHANHAVSARLKRFETGKNRSTHQAGASKHRQRRLYELMEKERGRLGPQQMLRNLSDHQNYPLSICCHREAAYQTTAAVVAEPSRGLLHVTRGAPCQNRPATYRLPSGRSPHPKSRK